MCDSCEKTEFGCCIDLENAAYGPDFEGCPDEDGSGGGFQDCAVSVREEIIVLFQMIIAFLVNTILYFTIFFEFCYRNMAAVQMVLLRLEEKTIKDVKMQLLAKMLLGDVVLTWFIQRMVQAKKVAVFLPNLAAVQIISRKQP